VKQCQFSLVVFESSESSRSAMGSALVARLEWNELTLGGREVIKGRVPLIPTPTTISRPSRCNFFLRLALTSVGSLLARLTGRRRWKAVGQGELAYVFNTFSHAHEHIQRAKEKHTRNHDEGSCSLTSFGGRAIASTRGGR